jgi:hypothetical protein
MQHCATRKPATAARFVTEPGLPSLVVVDLVVDLGDRDPVDA